MRRTLVLLLLCVSSKSLIAQNYPLYNGYFLNPFIYNPAAAASEKLQVNAGYRRQWLEIPNAPTVYSLTANTLLDETRAGVGLRISSSSRGFLRSTEFSLAYAYGVPLNSSSRLFFGLSGGVLSNSVNLSDVSNVNDPALGTLSSSMVPSISFGMLYKNTNGINLGFNLPKMVNSEQLDTKYSFTYLDDIVVSASFSRWNPTPKFVKGKSTKSYGKKKASSPPLEVFSLYRYSSFYGSLIEATAKYNFNKSIWLSATYRQNQGFVPGIGVNADNLSFSYFYEPGLGGDLPLKTHEVLLTLRLGKDKKFRDKPPVPPISKVTPPKQPTQIAKVQPKTTTPPVQNQVKKDVATQPVKKEEPVKKDVVTEPVKKETTQQVAAKTNVTPVKKDSAKTTVAKVEVPTKDPEAAKHHPRFNQSLSQLDLGNKKDTVTEAHEAERKELDKHIDEHAEGKHDDTHDVPVNQRHDFVKRGTHHEELELATYVIAGAFQSRGNAEHYVNTLKKLGYNTADFGHLSARNLWYVFIAEEAEIPEAKKDRDRLQKNKIFSTVWLLTVQQ